MPAYIVSILFFRKEGKNMISIKRANVYQYYFEVGKVNGKIKQIIKSGFKTKKRSLYSKTKGL